MSMHRRLITLSTLSGLLAQSARPEDMLPTAIEMVANVMEVEVVLIYSLEADKGELVLSAYRGVSSEFAQGVDRLRLGEGFNGQVAETGEPMMVSDIAHDPRLSRDVVRQEKLRAQLVVPMKSRGEVVGTISVATHRKREFDADEIELLTAIANQIGIAIDEARCYQEYMSTIDLLRQSEADYRELFQNASDAIIIHNLEGNITDANKACEKLLGYPLHELLGKKISGFLGKDALDLAREVGSKLLSGETIEQRYEQHLTRGDGSEAIIELATRVITTDGKPVGFHNICRDVTDERRMRDNLGFYIKQVLRAQEDERMRISRELHDDASQSLLLLIHRLDALASNTAGELAKPVQAEITKLHSLAVEILEGLRHYSQELRPAILDDLGLVAAMKWVADDLNRERGISVSVEICGPEHELSPDTKLVLFRIAQEALANVKRHSEAANALVRLEYEPEKITLTITDDGKGFQLPHRLGDLARVGRLGLIGMQERARLLGGTLQVRSMLGEGTTIIAELPYGGT